ncbi:MAG TPA: thioredoxin domain-containing protein [Bryobacteraceae bacterium]|jgi:protein-disulfide isomerase|nr:thioredoxin domain-containing protein [Bryobacteraceae bacterium]
MATNTPGDQLASSNGPAGDALSDLNLLLPIQPEDHVEGEPNMRYTLVEYGDYECPACGQLFQTIRELRRRYENQVRLVFRHYPLSGRHPHAQQASEAAEAAGAQNSFWPMHNMLFENQNALKFKDLIRYAGAIGFDAKRFRDELKRRIYEDRVREDFRRGVANGVYGTPGLFINGIRYNGGLEIEAILEHVKNREDAA